MYQYVVIVLVSIIFVGTSSTRNIFLLDGIERKYAYFNKSELEDAREMAKEMFYFGWENYLMHAFPDDEIDPIHCTGRSADHMNPSNININDVLGDYSLTLIDTLDSLVVFGDQDEFKRAVRLVIENVDFDKNTTVQVFESTIRVIGGLLSAHLIATDESRVLGDFYLEAYEGELLTLAQDLCDRLIVAFDNTMTEIPFTRVNLQKGVLPETVTSTCTAGAGSLLLEFGILSALVEDSKYGDVARKANHALWSKRNPTTGLLGNLIDIQTGEWLGHLSGLGAGLDSYFELMLKSYVLFGQENDLKMFNEAFESIMKHMRRGRKTCLDSQGESPLFVNVDARTGDIINTWIDSLQASLAGVLVLAGRVDEAVCQHAIYYAIWKKYGVLPERYNWKTRTPDVNFYPLRPEFAESTYLLYSATKNPFYQKVGLEIMDNIDRLTRVECGFATVHDVHDGSLEDRMESFFLAETMKYLYLLFDTDHPVNRNQEKIVFSTEGHIFPVSRRFRTRKSTLTEPQWTNSSCEAAPKFNVGAPPLKRVQIAQIFNEIGVQPNPWDSFN